MCSFHHQPPPFPCLPLFRSTDPRALLPLTSVRWCKGISASRKAQCLVSSKKGNSLHRHRPQDKTQSKTAPAHFGGSKTTPRLEHTSRSRIYTCCKSKRATGLPFPPPPCETLAGTTQPVTIITPLCSTSVLSGLEDICTQDGLPEGWDTPCPKTASGSHGEQELPSPGGCRFQIQQRSPVR